ncbi:MAG: hypothetical protein CMP26_13100 [Roseibacillus sp.]|nr:hypothetical protein [Roseibacillus sp.]
MNGHNPAHHNQSLKPVNEQTDMKQAISQTLAAMVVGIMLPAMCQTAAHADEKTGAHWAVFAHPSNPGGASPWVVKVASFKPVEGSAKLDVAKVPYSNPVMNRSESQATKDKPTAPVQAKANKLVAAPTQPKVINSGGPKRGIFPEEGAGVQIHGDLVISDPVNRRGALREKRHLPRHYFAMLPYGMVWYHGAPADIRDLPPGIHMHGRFLLPMEGEEETIPLTEKLLKNHENHRYNHAILLEDDVSFYSRRGRSWKVLGFEQGGGPAPRLKLSVEPVGPEIEGGINKAALFDIDNSTRVWRDRQLVNKDQIKEGMDVQVNLTWGPFDSLATTDVWLDESSLQANREIQRQRHLRMIRSRFLPGWIDAVKNNDSGGGEVTVTFFGGMDEELYDDIRKSQSLKICNAENTLRSWNYHQEYASPATILEKREIKDPPLGSSGLQVRLKVTQMLDGFRPGWVVRVKGPWAYVLLPWDEHINSAEAYEKSKKLILP